MTNKPYMERFLEKINFKDNGCWMWNASGNMQGYGQITVGGKHYPAHKFSYMQYIGELPLHRHAILHTCDNPGCVSPFHLVLGTNAENSADMVSKGRQALGSKHGMHKLTKEEVIEIISLRGRYTQAEIGAMFKVGQDTVSLIHTGKTWKHISR